MTDHEFSWTCPCAVCSHRPGLDGYDVVGALVGLGAIILSAATVVLVTWAIITQRLAP